MRLEPGSYKFARLPVRDLGEGVDRKSTRLNSSHTVIYTLSLHDALPISRRALGPSTRAAAADEARTGQLQVRPPAGQGSRRGCRSEEHTSELQSHRDLHSFPTRRSSDLAPSTRPEHSSGCG